MHDVFEPGGLRATGYTLLNEVLTLGVMALLIGLIPPA